MKPDNSSPACTPQVVSSPRPSWLFGEGNLSCYPFPPQQVTTSHGLFVVLLLLLAVSVIRKMLQKVEFTASHYLCLIRYNTSIQPEDGNNE